MNVEYFERCVYCWMFGLQIYFAYGNDHASDMFYRISRVYVQFMYVRILHHYGTLNILER